MIQGVKSSDRFKAGSGPVLDLVLARHGQSYGNLDRSLGPDTDLTDLGREQAARLGAWLEGQGYRFCCSIAARYAVRAR